jgi:hypothetical protein
VKRDGKWEAVPMCAMNQKVWSEVYDARLHNPALMAERQVFENVEAETTPTSA